MEKALRKTALKLSKETAFILLSVACAVILPQALHAAGVLLGVGGKLGQIFLPMYLPVLIIGLYRGSASGAVAGLLAPLVSFAMTGMPQAALLPYITLELIALGLFAGALLKIRLPAPLRVLLMLVAAKIIRLGTFAAGLYFANGTVAASLLFAGILISVPGIVILLVAGTCLIIGTNASGKT